MIRWAVLACTVAWLASAREARADFDSESRDGCPPGNLEVQKDVHYSSVAEAPVYTGTQSKQLGALPESSSALVPTGVVLGSTYTHFAPADATERARILEGDVQAHFNVPTSSELLGDRLSIGMSASIAGATVFSGDGLPGRPNPSPDAWGNLVLAPSLRFHGLTSMIDKTPRLATFRHAWAIQGLVAVPTADVDTRAARDRLVLTQRTPFESYRFAPYGAVGGFAEWRLEAVGCYAPFVHLRLGGVGGPSANPMTGQRDHSMVLAPETLALGFYPSPQVAVMFQYGLLVYWSDAAYRPDPLLSTNAVHRFRFAGELRKWKGVTLGAHLDLFRGASLYDGTVFGVVVGIGPTSEGWL